MSVSALSQASNCGAKIRVAAAAAALVKKKTLIRASSHRCSRKLESARRLFLDWLRLASTSRTCALSLSGMRAPSFHLDITGPALLCWLNGRLLKLMCALFFVLTSRRNIFIFYIFIRISRASFCCFAQN